MDSQPGDAHVIIRWVQTRGTPPLPKAADAMYVYVSRKKKLLRNKMIKIVTDEEVHEMDIELIELFAVYLFDKDVVGMTDLIYVEIGRAHV